MLTGASPFVGETVSDSIGAILHKDIDLDRLPPCTPRMVRHTLRRCLERDKALRYHDIGDVALDLSERFEAGSAVADSSGSRWLSLAGWLVAMIALVAVVVLSIGKFGGGPDSNTSVVRMDMSAPPDTQFIHFGDAAGPAIISPGGESIAFVAKTEGGVGKLWIRDLISGAARALPGTDGATFPFWSPDGRSLGFFIRNLLKRHDLESGVSYKVCDAPAGRGGTWTPGGEILFSPGFQEALYRVSADGGEPTLLTKLDESLHTSHRWPYMLPDGTRFLFNAIAHDPAEQENNMLMVGSLDGGEPTLLLRSPFRAEYVDGMLLYVVGNDLVAAPLDLDTLTLSSQRVVLSESILPDPSTWYAAFSASESGLLACVIEPNSAGEHSTAETGRTVFGVVADNISVVDRQGVIRGVIVDDLPHVSLYLSPDITRLALSAVPEGQQEMDIWIQPTGFDEASLERGDLSGVETMFVKNTALKRVTSKPGQEDNPAWSPDGREIAYGRFQGPEGSGGVFITDVESSAERRILPPDPLGRELYVTSWTGDGQWILFVAGSWNDSFGMLYAVRPEGGKPVLLVEGNNRIINGGVSPDGRWLAFSADTTGDWEAYVIPFAPAWPDLDLDPANPEPIWRVSTAGGQFPMWRSDGRELYYVTSTGSLIAVPTRIEGDVFGHDAGVVLFNWEYVFGMPIDVLPGGKYFFLSGTFIGSNTRVQITLNWQRLLKSGATP
jgi:Tol biopolymer transport system component